MRKLLVVFTLMVFIASMASTLVFALDPGQDKPGEPKVKCCFQDGQCLETRRENCALKQAIVVEDCSQCPGVWGEKSKKK
jgi:hypothetical protein